VRSTADRVPEGVVERLPLYLDALLLLAEQDGATVSSARLGELTNVNPAQIRRDLTHFGSFGQRGIGYDVGGLIAHIQRILGADHANRIALVGAGNLGTAIANYPALATHGFAVTSIFDNDADRVGRTIGGLVVQHADELAATIREQKIAIGIIAVPPFAAQEVADALCKAGVRVILNYTPVAVAVGPEVVLHNTDPVHELLHTLYYLSTRSGSELAEG
jgi:redox-sensing transcriptional repressor